MNLAGVFRNIMSALFTSKAEQAFDIKSIAQPEMNAFIRECAMVYHGAPKWAHDDIRSINFAKAVCSETSRLAMLATSIEIAGSERAEYLQGEIDKIYFLLRNWFELGCAYGSAIIKPNGMGVDILTPSDFVITDYDNGMPKGAVFKSSRYNADEKKWYSRLEYQHFIDEFGHYEIQNRIYKGDKKDDTTREVSIDDSPWRGLAEVATLENIEKPLFGFFRTPAANNIDIESPLGLPFFSEAMEELKDLDVAYSRNQAEIMDSQKILLLDSDRLMTAGGKYTPDGMRQTAESLRLPHYVRNVYGDGASTFYQEINPTLQTPTRIAGINHLLSLIGYKCGYSNGYFTLDERNGMITATQIEAEDRRTIQTIKDVRDRIEACMDGVVYGLNVFADLYDLAPVGKYEITYDFGDLTYNVEEDRARWLSYANMGIVPRWKILNKFEGMSEEEAKATVEEANPQNSLMEMFAQAQGGQPDGMPDEELTPPDEE